MAMHRIRLAGPWQVQSKLPDAVDSWTTVNLPFQLTASDPDASSVKLKRRFHSPTGIDDGTSISVAAIVNTALVFVRLNGHPLKKTSTASSTSNPSEQILVYDLTGRLRSFNELEIELQHCDSSVSCGLLAAELQIGSADNLP